MSHFSVAVFTRTGAEEEVDRLLAPYQENNLGDCPKEFLEFVKDEDADFDEVAGERGYWENPNAKWDWYKIGGRWHGLLVSKNARLKKRTSLPLKPRHQEDEFNSLPLSDIDFAEMEKRRIEELEPFEDCEERRFYTKEYFDRKYPTKEAYIRRNSEFSTYAVITPDGTWHSSGTMWWWGIRSETPEEAEEFRAKYKERFIDPAVANGWHLTVVDCHI